MQIYRKISVFKSYRKFNIFFCLVSIIVFLSACSKEERYDEQLLSAKISSNLISYIEKGDLIVLNGVNYARTSSFVGIPVRLTENSKVADTIIATIDPSLISEYNTQHGEHNPVLPDGAFEISSKGRFGISAGQAQSKDSLYITLKNGAGLKGQTAYLIPVRLSAQKNGKLLNEIIFFKMLLSASNLTAFIEGASGGNGVNGGRIPGGALSLVYFDYYPDSLKFNVSLNTIFDDHDVIVEGSLLSEAQMDSVILAQNFYAVPLPADYYKLTNKFTTISKGHLSGQDSLVVSFSDKDKLAKDQYYIMGVKLKHYTAAKFGVPPMPGDSSVCFVRFFMNP